MSTSQISIANASFEQTSHSDGSYSQGIPGWTITNSGSGEAGDYDPRSSEIDLSTVDGENVAYLYSGDSDGSGVTISQTLSATYQAGNIYTLSVDIGDGSYGDSGDQPFTLNILAGSTVIGTVSGTTDDIDSLRTVTLNSTLNDPSLNGQPLTIEISDPPGSGDGEFLVDNVEFFESVPQDGIVEGTGGADLIDSAYTGDPEGDQINDAISPLPGTGPNDDSVQAGAGNDTVVTGSGSDTIDGGAGADDLSGGAGADTLIGGSGNDTLEGGAGDDVLYGDSGPVTTGPESFNWIDAGPDDSDISAGVTQDTGGMTVTASFATGPINEDIETSDTTQYIGAGEPFDPNSALLLTSNSGSGDNATVTLNFVPEAGSGLSDEVENVAFRVNDIDQGGWQDIVTITAFDAAGDPVPVKITVDGDDNLSGNTVTAGGGSDSANEADGSILVEITAPVATVVIDYDNGYNNGQALWVTDVHFETLAADAGAAGNDVLDGGAGADLLYGEGGDDTLIAGENDTLVGGDGDDLFILGGQAEAGTGSINIIGGEGDETVGDTLVLTPDIGRDDITFTNEDDDAGGLSGTFTLEDGTLVSFTEIENIICFTPGTRILTPRGERPVETLRKGDLVITRDHGPRPVRWVGRRTVPGNGIFAPVRVGPAVIGNASGGLLVSPQHRLLITGYHAELLFACDEVLVAAKHLLGGTDAYVAPCAAVTYIHLMFDRHEVIYAEGFATESFFAGDAALTAVDAAAREELFMIFPDLRSSTSRHNETARPCLRAREAALLRERIAGRAA